MTVAVFAIRSFHVTVSKQPQPLALQTPGQFPGFEDHGRRSAHAGSQSRPLRRPHRSLRSS